MTAYVTYRLVPKINHQYKIDETRSNYLSETTKNLNEEIIYLSHKVRYLDESLENNDYVLAEKNRDECLDSIIKLQWTLVGIKVILKSDTEKEYINNLNTSIDNLKNIIGTPVKYQNRNNILAAMGDLAICTKNVLDELYKEASLK